MSTSDPTGWHLAHLHRRLGFGATPSQLASSGSDYNTTLDQLLSPAGPDGADGLPIPDLTPAYFGPTPTAEQRTKIQQQTTLQAAQKTFVQTAQLSIFKYL